MYKVNGICKYVFSEKGIIFLTFILLSISSNSQENVTKIPINTPTEDTLIFPFNSVGSKLRNHDSRFQLPINFKVLDSGIINFQFAFKNDNLKFQYPLAFYGFLNGKYGVIIDTKNDKNFLENEFVELKENESSPFIKLYNIPILVNKNIQVKSFIVQPFLSNIFVTPKKMFRYIPQYKIGNWKIGNKKYFFALNNPLLDTIYNKSTAILVFSNHELNKKSYETQYHIGDTIYFENLIYKFEDISGSGDTIIFKKIGVQQKNFGIEPGDYMHNLIYNDIVNNSEIKFNNSKKYTLFDFWGTWCGPCLLLMDSLKKINTFYSKKLRIIGISYDNKKEDVLELIKREHISWINIFDSKSQPNLIKKFKVSAFPTFILVDTNGKIVLREVGNDKGFLNIKNFISRNL